MSNENAENLAELIVDTGRLIHRKTGSFGVGNISMLRYKLLQFVCEKRDPTMKDIAVFLGVAPPTATVIVRRLIASGAIARKVREGDRRVIRVALTAIGKKIIADTRRQVIKRLHPLLQNLTKNEIASLSIILKKINEHYEK
jgi:MarR family transcriptional regulator, organic hydroperoxide resistance regulator